MTDAFQAMIDKHRARMTDLRQAFERDDRLYAISARDPSYSILLTRNGSSDAPWRVTSFRGKEPSGHREYDHLEGGSPTQNAFHEFSGSDFVLVRKPMPKRKRERKIKEAAEAITACEGAILRSPDELGRQVFGRSRRIWQRRCDALNDVDKLAEVWLQIRRDGQVRISWESAIWLMRTASYAILTRHEPPAPDRRQTSMDLRGGKLERIATIDVS